MTRITITPGLDPRRHARHTLHAESRVWVEKNCYVDVFIELLHAFGLEPLAMLGSSVVLDFEGDNFTFYKPSHDDLWELYGVDVQELNVWRPLLEHAIEHLDAGKAISTEADSFFLPDTDGTDYRRNHVKTTIIIAAVDAEAHRLEYFHNAGFFELSGEDFAGVFRLDSTSDVELPLFAELIRLDRRVRRAAHDLATKSRALLVRHMARRPARNPLEEFRARFERELPILQSRGLAHYHAWAFGTVRQVGAVCELLGAHLRWLHDCGQGEGFGAAADAFDRVSGGAKTFILKAARAVSTGKAFAFEPILGEMAARWDDGIAHVVLQLQREPAAEVAR